MLPLILVDDVTDVQKIPEGAYILLIPNNTTRHKEILSYVSKYTNHYFYAVTVTDEVNTGGE